jgi:hypothetical protein
MVIGPDRKERPVAEARYPAQFSYALSQEDYDKIKVIAEKNGVTMADVQRDINRVFWESLTQGLVKAP